VATPDTELDDVHQTISLRFFINEDRQFRLGAIQILGLDPKHIRLLRSKLVESKLEPGAPFNSKAAEDFFKQNRSVFPLGSSPGDVHVDYDNRDGTVAMVFDLRFDYRRCRPRSLPPG
jgi:outer membrane protein assembly factor BamA